MGEIYVTQSKLHRSGVTTVDASDPADTSGAIDTKGYEECRFDITITGTINRLYSGIPVSKPGGVAVREPLSLPVNMPWWSIVEGLSYFSK